MKLEDKRILKIVSGLDNLPHSAYNIRINGKKSARNITENINIISKEDKDGIDIIVKPNTKGESIHIPVVLSKSGLKDVVYNDFYIGENAEVTIVAGCGIHNDSEQESGHDGIHRLFLEKNSNVKYVEKHYGEGNGVKNKVLNPITEIYLKEGSYLEMDTAQISGISSSDRKTIANLEANTTFIVSEKIMTHSTQFANTEFILSLNGENSSAHIKSRSVATEDSTQHFISKVYGNNKCFAHVECDAIIKDNAKVISTPEVTASNIDANLIHEAAIGKIAGEQLTKLMTLGLDEKQAEEAIITGFLK